MFDDVLVANDAFYDAHERRDLDAMSEVRDHTDEVVCTHPGWPILRTRPLVEASWQRIFEGAGRNQFIIKCGKPRPEPWRRPTCSSAPILDGRSCCITARR